MKRVRLGLTDLMVSPLCMGTLTVGPTQKNLPQQEAADLVIRAYELGINFFDSAEIYGTYPILGLALQTYPELIVTGKSYAVTADEMRKSIEKARKELNRDYIDIFCLHEVENSAALKGHRGALDYLYEARQRGIVRAVGISTHTVAGVRAGANEPGIEVIHPLINRAGIGIKDGTVDDMIAAIRTAREFGKGIYAMKVLGGGHLYREAVESIRFVRQLGIVDSIAIGMQSEAEIRFNRMLVEGETPPPDLGDEVAGTARALQIEDWCCGCGRCVARCGFEALHLENGVAKVDRARCMMCGYCARVCPEFCLKIV